MRWPHIYERFWLKVHKTQSCWLWIGAKWPFGHGKIKNGKRTLVAHRISWEIHFGVIPDGLCVLHKCDIPSCVNPDHLFLGTKTDNNLDRDSKNRQASGDRSGLRVHPDRVCRGEKQWNSKLTPSDVDEIRLRFSMGESQTSLSKIFPVCQSHISKIILNQAWAHIP
jgi:hypothetical protein